MNIQQTSGSSSKPARFVMPTTKDEIWELQRATTELLREHETRVARNKYVALHGPADPTKPDKWFREQAVKPAEATAKKYIGRGGQLFRDAQDERRCVWELSEERSTTGSSWSTGKAALQFYLADRLREGKRCIDSVMDESGKGLPIDLGMFRHCLKITVDLANALDMLPSAKPTKFQPGSGFRQVRRSKSISVRKADEHWRERVADALVPKYLFSWLTQCATGCRPQELANGVDLKLLANGSLAFRVKGAKVGTRSGQQWREACISAGEEGIVKRLMAGMKPGVHYSCQLPSTVDTYCKAIARCCRKLFPNADPRKRLTAYSARHQRKADWARAGMSRDDLAKALGHRTIRSANYYGRRVKGSKGAVRPTSVRASQGIAAKQAPDWNSLPTRKAKGTARTRSTSSARQPRRRRPAP